MAKGEARPLHHEQEKENDCESEGRGRVPVVGVRLRESAALHHGRHGGVRASGALARGGM
jgi:hypothetical protein